MIRGGSAVHACRPQETSGRNGHGSCSEAQETLAAVGGDPCRSDRLCRRRPRRLDHRDGLHDRRRPPTRRSRRALDACAAQTGISGRPAAGALSDLVQKVLLAASSNSLPDIIYIDNSDVAQLADGGYIAPLKDVGFKIEGFVPALAGARRIQGNRLRRAVGQQHHRALLQHRPAEGGRRRAAEDLGRTEGEAAKKLTEGPDLRPRLPGHQQRAGHLPHIDLRLVERRNVREAQLPGDRRRHSPSS